MRYSKGVAPPSHSTPSPIFSWLIRVNPFLKIALSCLIIMLALWLKSAIAMGILIGGLLLLLPQQRLKLRPILIALFTFVTFALLSVVFLGSVEKAIVSTLRLIAIALPAPVLALSTAPSDLVRALQGAKLPSFITLSVTLIWRFFPLIIKEVQRIWEANLLRGIDLRKRPMQWFSGMMVPLIFQMVVYADDVTVGLQTRGYSPDAPRSNSKPLTWRVNDTLFCMGVTLWIIIICFVEWG